MGQIKAILGNLTLRQQISIGAAVVVVIAALVALTNWRRERDFKPLFTNLAPEDASAVVQKLRETGSDLRLSENGTAVLVPSARVAELRLQMAGAGLPRSGRAGFEIFDKTNFGVTDFTEHINYRRALEGELERSVMSLSEVEQARVHVTFPKDSVFLEQRQPAKASVMVRLRPGARLLNPNVLAIAHLVASAVEGLAPDSVSVLDMSGNLLSRPRRALLDDSGAGSEGTLEYKQQVERDLLAKINTTLEPLLGAERFRAGVSVECDFSGGEQTEESFDPSRSVMTSSQKTEDVSGSAVSAGVPGTASSLPRPTARASASGPGMTRRTESISYQSSRLVRRVKLPQGTLKRISASVLVDQPVRWEGTGRNARKVMEPPAPEKLKSIRELVAAAIGLDTGRGDQLIIESLPFESNFTTDVPPAAGPAAAPVRPAPKNLIESLREQPVWVAAAAVAALLLLATVFLVVRKLHRQLPKAKVHLPGELPPGDGRALEPSGSMAVAEKELASKLAEQQALKEKLEAEALGALKLPPVTTKKAEVLAKHISESVKKDPTAAAQILRSWLYDGERR